MTGRDGGVQALLDEALRERDDAVAAHRAVALVVHEQDGHVGVVAVGRQEHGAVHVAVTARLVHQHPADMVGVLAHPRSAFCDGRLWHRRIAGADQTQGLAGAVEVERLDHEARALARARLGFGPLERAAGDLGHAPADGLVLGEGVGQVHRLVHHREHVLLALGAPTP